MTSLILPWKVSMGNGPLTDYKIHQYGNWMKSTFERIAQYLNRITMALWWFEEPIFDNSKNCRQCVNWVHLWMDGQVQSIYNQITICEPRAVFWAEFGPSVSQEPVVSHGLSVGLWRILLEWYLVPRCLIWQQHFAWWLRSRACSNWAGHAALLSWTLFLGLVGLEHFLSFVWFSWVGMSLRSVGKTCDIHSTVFYRLHYFFHISFLDSIVPFDGPASYIWEFNLIIWSHPHNLLLWI